MIRAFLRRLFGVRQRAASAIPPGQRVYAIGDIHGRADLLDDMARLIEADIRARPGARALIVLLGDYIDRGPDSAAVLDRLARGDLPAPALALRGNHDDLFLQFVGGQLGLGDFRRLGGDATLASYGIEMAALKGIGGAARSAVLRRAIPPEHIAFLDATAFSHSLGDYFFCHAGARPGVPLDAQSPDDLMWIREEFLRSGHDFGKMVVHGHTPRKAPEVRSNGINVDTKAFATGTLTAVVLEGTGRRFLQT